MGNLSLPWSNFPELAIELGINAIVELQAGPRRREFLNKAHELCIKVQLYPLRAIVAVF